MPPVSNPPGFDPHKTVESIQQKLQENLGTRRYQHWFGTSTQLELNESTLLVHVQSPYLVKWIQKQFAPLLQQIAAQHIGPSARVSFEVGGEVSLTPLPESTEVTPMVQSVGRRIDKDSLSKKRKINRKTMRLADFVVGPCNELSMAAVLQVSNDPGSISPLYIHGNVGNGKTHLLEGTRQQIRKNFPQLQVMVITAEQFGNYFSQALSARTLPSFRQKFRSVDVLLVDDVDFFDGKSGFQEEFLHTVKQFEDDQRQMIITSNRHPRLLSRTSEELMSRFMSGLVCRLETPGLQTRIEIVKRHATRHGAAFNAGSIEYIASRFTSNGRELEGAVNLLSTWSTMSKKTVTTKVARDLLGRLERDCMRIVRMVDVETAVCELFGVDRQDLKSKSRKQALAQPRMLAMFLARKMTQTPYTEIGEFFGGRNHSTVMSAEKKISEQLETRGTIRISSETWTVQDIIETLEDRIRAC